MSITTESAKAIIKSWGLKINEATVIDAANAIVILGTPGTELSRRQAVTALIQSLKAQYRSPGIDIGEVIIKCQNGVLQFHFDYRGIGSGPCGNLTEAELKERKDARTAERVTPPPAISLPLASAALPTSSSSASSAPVVRSAPVIEVAGRRRPPPPPPLPSQPVGSELDDKHGDEASKIEARKIEALKIAARIEALAWNNPLMKQLHALKNQNPGSSIEQLMALHKAGVPVFFQGITENDRANERQKVAFNWLSYGDKIKQSKKELKELPQTETIQTLLQDLEAMEKLHKERSDGGAITSPSPVEQFGLDAMALLIAFEKEHQRLELENLQKALEIARLVALADEARQRLLQEKMGAEIAQAARDAKAAAEAAARAALEAKVAAVEARAAALAAKAAAERAALERIEKERAERERAERVRADDLAKKLLKAYRVGIAANPKMRFKP